MTADYDEADVEVIAEAIRMWGMGPMNFQMAADKLLAAVAPSIAAKARAAAEAERDVARALADRYAPSPKMAELLERSSLGTDEAEAARSSVSKDAGYALVQLSKVMAERDTLGERIALAIEAEAQQTLTDREPFPSDELREQYLNAMDDAAGIARDTTTDRSGT